MVKHILRTIRVSRTIDIKFSVHDTSVKKSGMLKGKDEKLSKLKHTCTTR